MKKTSVILVLGLALMLLVVGCASTADRGQYDYVPYGGAGCGFAVSNDDCKISEDVVESQLVEVEIF